MFNRFLHFNLYPIAFLGLGLLLMGCTSHNREESSDAKEDPNREKASSLHAVHIPPIPSQGVYWLNQEKPEPLTTGSSTNLLPTNAERGFGFSIPVGPRLSGPLESWIANTSTLKIDQIQLTQYRGVAASVPYPYTAVDDSNTAWLAEKNIPISSICDKNTCLFQTQTPLSPGFYILHDDSLFRAVHAKDVSAYYPFIVTHEGRDPWITQAKSCFDEISVALRNRTNSKSNKKDSSAVSDTAPNALQACIDSLRLARKLSPNDDNAYALKLLYLARALMPKNDNVRRELLRQGAPEARGLACEIWQTAKIDWLDNLTQYLALLRRNPNDSKIAELEHAIVISALADADDATPFEALLSIPFLRLSPNEPKLAELLEAILQNTDWKIPLAELLGAIAYHDISRYAQNDKSFAASLKSLQTRFPNTFKTHANSLDFRPEENEVAVGPIKFTGIPNGELPLWRATLQGYSSAIRTCTSTHEPSQNALFILELALNGSPLTPSPRIVVRAPNAKRLAPPVISHELVACLVSAFADIPLTPTLETTQRAYIALAFGSNKTKNKSDDI